MRLIDRLCLAEAARGRSVEVLNVDWARRGLVDHVDWA